MPSGMELAVSCLAIACGAVCIPLNPRLTSTELLAQLDDASADAIVGLPDDPMAARIAQTLGLVPLTFDMQRWLDSPSGSEKAGADAPWPEPAHTAFVLMTSGTTGKSKRVPLKQQQIVHSALQTAHHLELSPEDRSLCVMPVYHSQGLIVGLLAPLVSGSSVVCTPAFDATEFLRWAREFRPTWYTATPTVHQAVVDHVSRNHSGMPPHAFRLIRSASSSLPAGLQHRIEDLWGVPVIQGYGITETAGPLSSNPLPPDVQKAESIGRPVGAELRVIDDEGHPLKVGQLGAVMARGPSVFDGYEDAPRSNADAFRDGWFHTGDLGWFDEDGFFFLAGRSKELINRGGEKISPFEVEQALLRLTGVAQAVAYPVDHPTMGEDVHAAVVPAPDSAVSGQFLRSRLFGVIADFKVPACIHVVDRIPVGPGGKVQRLGLRHQISGGIEAAPAAPLTPFQAHIALLFAQTLDQPMSPSNANFLALGGDSLSALRLARTVNETWGLDLSASALLAAPTVVAFAATVQAAIEEADALSSALQADLDALSDDEVARLLGTDPMGR